MTDQGPARDAMIEQAVAKLQAGHFEDAIEAFSATLLIAPQDSEAYRGRATSRFQIKDWSGAEADFRKALELDPSSEENRLGVAMTLAMKLDVYPAITEFEVLIKQHPQFVRAYIHLGLLQIKVGAITKGKEVLQEALKHRPALAERKMIEKTIRDQEELDKKRFYRPDFEALKKRKKS